MRIMPTSPPSRRLGPPWLEGRRRLYIGLTGLLLVLVAGTIGYVGFGLSLLDALFQTVITVSTVGFGEARPFGSGAKVFTIVLIFVGVATAAYTFGVGIDTLVEGYVDGTFGRRRMERRIGAMRGHMILCGWGRVGQAIARRAGGADMVVVDASAERIGTVSGPYVHGDATSEEVLRAAGIDRARVLLRIVREIYDAVGRGDAPAILDRVTDDVDWSAEADSHAAPWYGARVGKAGVASFFSDLADSIEITEFTPHSFAAGQDDVHLLVRWTFRSITTGQQASMTMHHYWRIRDGKIEHFRGSEDTEQTARILTPDLTPAPNP